MVNKTEKLNLIITDYQKDTGEKFFNDVVSNFLRIEETLGILYLNEISNLPYNVKYEHNLKVYNSNPKQGGFIGWVNLRSGVNARTRLDNFSYNVGDFVSPKIDNGLVYQCVSDGVSSPLEPIYSFSKDEVFYDLPPNIDKWLPLKSYNVNDIVIKSNGDKSFYYKCLISGLSSQNEANWIDSQGINVNDGTVLWQCFKTVSWKVSENSCNFRPFGKIE